MFDCLLVCFIMENCTKTIYQCSSCDILAGEIDTFSLLIGMGGLFMCLCLAICFASYRARQNEAIEPQMDESEEWDRRPTNRLNINVIQEEEKANSVMEIEANHIPSPKSSVTRRNVSEIGTQTDPMPNSIKYQNIVIKI